MKPKQPSRAAMAAMTRLAREIIHGGEETVFDVYKKTGKDPVKCLHADRYIVAREMIRLYLEKPCKTKR